MSDDEDWYELLAEAEFWDGFFAALDGAVGFTAFTLLAGVPLMLALYSWSGTFLMPAIVLALFGGTLIATAPPQVALIGALMVATAVTITLLTIWSDSA